jgi:signal transduction histidine kinase
MAELSVTDTGIGIPTDDLALLGNRFHRVETPGGRSQEGTGIGNLTFTTQRWILCVEQV